MLHTNVEIDIVTKYYYSCVHVQYNYNSVGTTHYCVFSLGTRLMYYRDRIVLIYIIFDRLHAFCEVLHIM